MAKKSKNDNPYASKEPFSLAVCNRIRWCVGKRSEALAARDEAFDKRDSLQAQLVKAFENKASPAELIEAKAKVYDAEREIEDLRHAINFYAKTISETVEEADSPELDGMVDERPMPDAVPIAKPKPVPAKAPEFPHADGVDEHLDAAVGELDIPEKLIGKVVAAGFEKIGQLAKFADAPENSPFTVKFGARAEISNADAMSVHNALEAYRKKHRKASLEVEREAVEA